MFRSSIDEMQDDYSRIWPYAIAVLVILLMYRRFRRNFGRQRLRPVRMRVRIVVFSLLACAMLPMALKSGQFLVSEMAGLLSGAALGVWGSQRTRYLAYKGEYYYVPHTYTGIAVSLLLVGRLVYRIAQVYLNGAMPDAAASGSGALAAQSFYPATMVRSPMTVGLLCVVVGYYVCYYSRVLWKHKHITPEDLEAPSASSMSSP